MQPALLYVFMPLQRCTGKEVQCESVVSGMAACRMQLFSAFQAPFGVGSRVISNRQLTLCYFSVGSRVLAFSHPHSFRSTGYKLSFPLNSLRSRPYVCAFTYQLATCSFCLHLPGSSCNSAPRRTPFFESAALLATPTSPPPTLPET